MHPCPTWRMPQSHLQLSLPVVLWLLQSHWCELRYQYGIESAVPTINSCPRGRMINLPLARPSPGVEYVFLEVIIVVCWFVPTRSADKQERLSSTWLGLLGEWLWTGAKQAEELALDPHSPFLRSPSAQLIWSYPSEVVRKKWLSARSLTSSPYLSPRVDISKVLINFFHTRSFVQEKETKQYTGSALTFATSAPTQYPPAEHKGCIISNSTYRGH